MPNQYLFLNTAQQTNADGVVTWNNLPTLGASTRECYVSILDMDVVFSSAISKDELLIKTNLPSRNYYSSNNDGPVLRYLTTADGKVFNPALETSVHLLSNDNVKSFQIELFHSNGVAVTDAIESINLTLQFDYVDQKAMVNNYVEELPMHLGGGR